MDNLRDRLSQALKGHRADYVEIRVEEREQARLQYRGKELEEVVRSHSLGGNVRAMVKGGWGFVSFNSLESLKERVAEAVRRARFVGKEESHLAPVEPRVDIVPPLLRKDPRAIPLVRKKAQMDEYLELAWSVPGILSLILGYEDTFREQAFLSSEGSFIQQGRCDVITRLSVMARDGGNVQQNTLSVGSLGDYTLAENLHRQVKETAEKAVALLSAPQAKGGEYTVILDPVLAGVFAHEAFGHLSESDFLYENEHLKGVMVLGKRFGGEHLNIVDGAAVPGLRGSYKYDDEGVPSTKTYLIQKGVLGGRLHSRETAAKMRERPTGNARALDFRHAPIVRMTNTFIEPGQVSLEGMLSEINDGIYARNWYGGMTSMEMFTFTSGEAYRIRNGKIAELIRPVMLSGNIFTTLANIDAVGNDLSFNEGGGCGKGEQVPLPVSNGSPHIRIRHCLIAGG